MAATAMQQAIIKVLAIGVDQTTESARAWARDGVQVPGISGGLPEEMISFEGSHRRQPLAALLPSLPAVGVCSSDLPEFPPIQRRERPLVSLGLVGAARGGKSDVTTPMRVRARPSCVTRKCIELKNVSEGWLVFRIKN
jgi:hypothetical protein